LIFNMATRHGRLPLGMMLALAVIVPGKALAQYEIVPGRVELIAVQGGAAPAGVSVRVGLSGVYPVFSLYGGTPVGSWLSHNAGNGFAVAPLGGGRSEGSFQVSGDQAGLAPGSYQGSIDLLTAPGGATRVGVVNVSLTVLPAPTLTVSPSSVTLYSIQGEPVTPQVVTVSGTQPSYGAITYTVTTDKPFVTLSSPTGKFTAGGSDTFTVGFDASKVAGLPAPYEATIVVTASNGLVRTVQFVGAVLVGEAVPLTVTPSVLPLTVQKGGSIRGTALVYLASDTRIVIEPSASTPWLKVTPNVIVGKPVGAVSTLISVEIDAGLLAASEAPQTALIALRRTSGVLINDITMRVALTVTPPDEFSVDKEAVSFAVEAGSAAASPAIQTIRVTNRGTAISYAIQPSATWIRASKNRGDLGLNGSDSFDLSVDASRLPLGMSSGTVTIGWSGRADKTVAVMVQVAPPAEEAKDLTVSASALTFSGTAGRAGSDPASQVIAVGNTGPAVNYAVSASESWIVLTKSGGTLGANGSDSLSVSADASGLSVGTHTGTVTFTAAARPSRTVGVTFTVSAPLPPGEPPPVLTDLTVSAARLSFGAAAGTGPQGVVVANSGPAVAYVVSASESWIQLSKAGGNLGVNGSDTFAVSVSGTAPEGGVLTGTVVVSAAGRPSRSLAIAYEGRPATTATLEVWPAELTFYADAGQAPLPQAVAVTASDGSRRDVGVSAVSGANWLAAESEMQTPGLVGVRVAPSNVTRPAVGQIGLSPGSLAVAAATVPVTLRAMGAPVYSIPRVADGNGFATTITLSNVDASEAKVSLTFFKEDGQGNTGPWSPLMEGDAAVANVVIPVGGSVTWRTRGQGVLGENGWALVTCDQRISGFAVFRQTHPGEAAQEVAVPMNSSWQQRFLLPFDNLGNVTSVALSNVSETEPASISATFRDEKGALLASGYTRVLPARGHIAFALPVENRRGTAEFAASGGRLSAVGLRFSASSAAVTSFEPQSLNVITGGPLSIPQIADGVFADNSAAFTTSITVVNNDVAPARVTLKCYRQNAGDTSTQPWTPAMQGGPGMEGVTIPPGSSFTWRTAGTDSLSVGWAEVISAQRVSGFAVFRQTAPGRAAQEAAVAVNAGAQVRFLLPFDNREAVTTVALANISGSEAAVIDVAVRDEQQRVVGTASLSLVARGHDAFALSRFAGVAGARGTVEFRVRSGQISAVGLRFAGEAFTSFRPQVF
jgi:hypothetical protein